MSISCRMDGGLAGVQWMLLDPEPHDALRQMLTALLSATVTLGPCRLHRAKYKPNRHLKAYYDVTIHDPASGRDNSRQIEVTWMPPGSEDRRRAMSDFERMQGEAIRAGLAVPFKQLMAEAPEWGMRVQIAPLDVRFPQLVRLSDPRYVREILAASFTADGGTQAEAPASRYAVTAIRYRPGQRHVLRYDRADGAERDSRGTVFAKIYNSEQGARTFRLVRRVSDWLASHGTGMTAGRPLAYFPDDAAALYSCVSGTPLSQALRAPSPNTHAHLQRAGAALAVLHGIPTTLVELQPHSFPKEIEGIVSASKHVAALLPATGSRILAILDRARALHEWLPQEEMGFAHGDFKADHLWITPAGLTLMDFDTCYLFDRAIDLGKFLADLHWWYDCYGQPGVEQAQHQFLAGYMPGAPSERLLRARLYEVLVLIKTTVRRVRLFDTDWRPRTERLIDCAEALLNGLQRSIDP